jgi:rubredoxin
MSKHKCDGCKYLYETEVSRSKSGYNPLVDDYVSVSIKEKKNCCGVSPGGVLLDKEQPRCKDFEDDQS